MIAAAKAGQNSPGSARTLDAIGLAALAGVTAVAYFLGAAPLLERHAGQIEQQAELVAARERSSETAQTLVALEEESTRVHQRFVANPLRLQPAELINQRLALVTELAAECGAVLDDLQPGKTTEGPRYGSLPIHVAGTGAYDTFSALLRRIRERCPDMGVTSFEVSAVPNAEQEAPAKFNFELVWYTQPSASPAKAQAAKSGDHK